MNTRLGCESPELAALLRSDRPLTSVGDPCRTSHRPKIYLTRTRLSRESIVMATSMRATVEAEALELQATARPIRSVDRELRLEVDPEHGVMIDGLTGSQSFAVLLLRGETAAYRRLPEPPWPVLYHPSRRELAQNVNHRGGSGRMWALLWYPSLHSMHWQIEAVASQKHHFFEEPYASVDEAWLEEAELITFHWRWLGTVRWSVELDGVEIGRPD